MGKDLKGKEIGAGIVQQPNGTYFARFVDKFGKRRTKRSKKLQEVKQWLADATYIDQHSDLDQAADMLVDTWFDYWIGMHVLRHTFATRCIEGGMKPKTLQKILGHSNIGITMNLYVHITEDEKHREIDLVADALKVV
ncbi:MAG: tyrosine-type recombinase/integrase [Eubacterium sp.]|nr:tyrosine-type recombinase/integrase [Eubacterium sp.]